MNKFHDWNVFIGSKTGLLKGVHVSDNGVKSKNLLKLDNVTNRNGVTCLSWGSKEETEVLVGYNNQTVKIYDTDVSMFTFDSQLNCGVGPIKGLSKYQEKLLTATESGVVRQWDIDTKVKSEDKLFVGERLERMRHNFDDINCIATGGKENDLKLWDLQKSAVTFAAKNVPHDELQLRVRIWVSDIAFLPQSSKVAISSRYGFVRLYDPKSSWRRPVLSVTIPDEVLTCISICSRDDHVLVGSGTGRIYLIDFRKRGFMVKQLKGFVGSVKQIASTKDSPYVVSVGLDRHLRVHELDSSRLVYKEYLQSRLTSVVLRSKFMVPEPQDTKDVINVEDTGDVLMTIKDDGEMLIKDEDDVYDALVRTPDSPVQSKRIRSSLNEEQNGDEFDETSSTTENNVDIEGQKKRRRKRKKPAKKYRLW